MSAIRLPITAGLYSRKQGDIQTSDFQPPICHPERSEGSRYKALVSLSLVNTGRREDIRLSDGRHQTYIIPERKGVQAPSAPGFKPTSGSRPRRLRFRPQSGLVQRELYMLPAAAPHERKRTQPFYTTCREAAPLFIFAAPAATTTLGPKARQTLEP